MKLTDALAACLVGLLPATTGSAKDAQPAVEEARIQQHITELSKFGANPEGGVSRVAFSDADIAGREYIKKLMQDAGSDVRVDTAGNIIGRRDGTRSEAASDHDRLAHRLRARRRQLRRRRRRDGRDRGRADAAERGVVCAIRSKSSTSRTRRAARSAASR